MPSSCCIPKCKNTTKDGFHLFRFPLNHPDILKLWINAIGRDFKPTKSHLICSAHFVATDFMERPNASGVRLKNLAVPSIFFEVPAPVLTPAPASAVIMPAIAWKSILKPKEDNSTFFALIPSSNTEPASKSATVDTIRMTMRKPTKVMDSSLLSLKKQEMSSREKQMRRTIKSLKQKLKRKEEKIHSLKNLLKNLRCSNR